VLLAYSVDHAARLTGLSRTRLTRWDRLGFFSPELADPDDRGNPYSRVYSFNDLVGLRTLKILADKYRVPLGELRKAHEILSKEIGRPWSEIRLTVANRKIVIYDEKGRPVNVTDGQYSFNDIPLPEIAADVAEKSKELRKRNAALLGATTRHKFIAHNARVIAGTRIPVSAVESFIKAGYADKAIVDEYPTLELVDISAVRQSMKVAA
jgi:DNA-binding transcriptional MerR regulator